MVQKANTIWRDHETEGVPASGEHEPEKADIRAWGTYLESVIAAGTLSDAVWKDTKANLDADLAHAADTIGVVYDDSTKTNNGLYKKSGASGSGSWTQLTTFLPGYQFVTATDNGNSTANAMTMDTSPRLPSGDGVALVSFVVPVTNTSEDVTVSFDGDTALAIKTASGNKPAVGGLVAGMPILGVVATGGTEFRMRSDQAAAAVQAAAEAAQAAAEDWAIRPEDDPVPASSGGDGSTTFSALHWAKKSEASATVSSGAMTTVLDPQFATKATAEAYSPDVAPDYIRTAGYSAAGDGGGALYKKVASEPSHAGKFSITLSDGETVVWYELAESRISPQMLGAAADGASDGTGTDDTTAIRNSIAVAKALNGVAVGHGSYRITDKVVFNWTCDYRAATFYATDTAATNIAIEMSTGSAADPTDSLLGYQVGNSFYFPAVFNTQHTAGDGWTGLGIGLRYVNCRRFNDVHENRIEGFETGIQQLGNGAGCAYIGVVTAADINNCKISRRISAQGTGGYCNRWDYFGGNYSLSSAEGTEIPGTRFFLIDGDASSLINDHNFYGGSWEGDGPEWHIDSAGAYCQWHSPRFETQTTDIKVRFRQVATSGEGCFNTIFANRGTDQIVVTETGGAQANQIHSARGGSRIQTQGAPAFALQPTSGFGPLMVGIGVGDDVFSADPDTDYAAYFGNDKIGGKRVTDTADRIYMDLLNGRLYFSGDGGITGPTNYIFGQSARLGPNVNWVPEGDDSLLLGQSNHRWSEVYAATGTINTSDAREKEWRGGLNDAEMRVAKRLSKLVGIYQWKSAIEKKGDDARLHCGVTAQDVKAAFEAEGLDGFRYGVLCYDEWEAEPPEINEDTGETIRVALEAGDRYGIRYDQLWAFVAAGFEARLSALEA